MLAKLEEIEARFNDVLAQMADPAVISDIKRYRELASEHRQLEPVVDGLQAYRKVLSDLEEGRSLLQDEDAEVREMAREEVSALEPRVEELESAIRLLLLPKDPRDSKNVILEVRAGTGGDEAALFAGDVFGMYSRFCDGKGWKIEVLSQSATDIGGLKELTCRISGRAVFSKLKYESGVHRVQRVPVTETQGRIHTSACTVAILPEVDEVELHIPDSDLRIDRYRSSGPGGQSVNTTDSAIRATHLPSGLVVQCQDEKSQHKNKAKALTILRARVLEQIEAEAHAERAADRRSQVGSGDRSERIRTYNFPQNRLTDHRIGLTIYKLDQIMLGDLEQVIGPVLAHFQAEQLKRSSHT